MKRKILLGAAIGLLIFLGAYAALLFTPRQYDVPHFQARPGTQYWELTTGSRIGYTKVPAVGAGKANPIIYLHGGPGGAIYDSNIAVLGTLAQDGYDVYLYDQVGSGHSERLENIAEYSVDRHVRDLEEIVNTIGAAKIILIGQSWGGILGSLYIAHHADRIEKVVFTGPGPLQPHIPSLQQLSPPDSLQLHAPQYSNAEANAATSNFRSRWMERWAIMFGKKLATDAEADDFNTFRTAQTNKSMVCDTALAPKAAAGSGYYAALMTYHSFDQIRDPRAELALCKFPVLVMKGQCDNQAWGYTHEYLEVFPNARLAVIAGAGHAIAAERKEEYLHILRGFLAE